MLRAVVCAALVALDAAGLAAQQPAAAPPGAAVGARSCAVSIDSTGRQALFVKVATRTGQDYQAFAGGGVFGHCANEPWTTMQSDSLAWYPERSEAQFIRNVHFRDSTTSLDADRLNYLVMQEDLYAEGNVFTVNLHTRSSLRGPNLDYRRARPGIRDTAEMYATRRPTIRFYSARDSVRGDSAEPFVIVADRARMRGNDQMWGGGNVTVDRSDVAAHSDSAALDLGANNAGSLVGGPPVVDGRGANHYRLTGTRIQVGLNADHDLRRILAQGAADAVGPDWHLRSDTLDLALDSGKIQQAEAWGRGHRPDALSGSYTVVADSLHILMPGQVVRETWGYGHGRATDRPDSTVTEDDWMVGDTLHAEFAPADSVAPDSASRRKQELRHLTSHGSARALYHIVDDAHKDLPPGINYSRGTRIAIAMRAGKVSTVDVVGQVDGVYLEPAPRRPAADSTRAPADSAGRSPAQTPPGGPAHAPADSTNRAAPPPTPPSPVRRLPGAMPEPRP
jgi:lipopolysaccharide export system protein LptA